MRIFLLCLVLGATATLLSSCASDSYPSGSPDLQHMPPAPAVGY